MMMLSTLTRTYRALAESVAATLNASRLSASARSFGRRAVPARFDSVIEQLEERALMSTYYVSVGGNDSNNGTSTASAWRSIGKVNSANLNPGDSVLFQGGQTFYGSLSFGSGDSGSASSPVTIGSYNGQATINAGTSNGATVLNASGIWFDNLKFVGTPGASTQDGILFEGYSRGVYYSNDQVNDCDISGFWNAGILVAGGYTNGGLTGLRITNSSVYNNVESGIQSTGPSPTSDYNLYIGGNQVYNNYGDGVNAATGNGIELGFVTGAMVENNVAYLNGSKGGIGGVGIWAYDADQVTFQYNESYDNKTTRGNDGDGFDFDADVSNSVMQYNYAFGNDGTGAQLDQWRKDSLFTNDIVRYNVFQDNGRKNSYGNLEVWGYVLNSYLYNNVIYTTPGSSGSNSGIRVHNSTIPGLYVDGVHFVNNIIDTTGGATLVNIPESEAVGAQDLTFTGNVYWTNGATANFIDGKTALHSLAQWQSAGQETWGNKKYGIFANPEFVSSNTSVATAAASADSLQSAAAGYKLQASSPALSETLSVASMYGITTGGADYFGNALASTAATIAGADQTLTGATATPVVTNPTDPVVPAPTAPLTNVSKLTGYDLGAVGSNGSNSASSGTFTVTAGGADIWGSNDAFRYDETSLSGNGTIVARVSSLTDANAWAKAGVMIRSSLATNATEVSMLLSPDQSDNFQRRYTAGGATSTTTGTDAGDQWVKLVRNGNSFTGYISSDGINWKLTSTASVTMGTNVLVGLAVTAHESKGTETAVFSNVSIT